MSAEGTCKGTWATCSVTGVRRFYQGACSVLAGETPPPYAERCGFALCIGCIPNGPTPNEQDPPEKQAA